MERRIFLFAFLVLATYGDPGYLRKHQSTGNDTSSSLFQAYAIGPYPNAPNYYPYMPIYPPGGYMISYDQAGQPFVMQQPPQGAPVMMNQPQMYYPQMAGQPPQIMAPPQQYGGYVPVPRDGNQPTYVQYVPVRPADPAPRAEATKPEVTRSVVPVNTQFKVDVPHVESPDTPMKDALRKELDNAAKALDNIGSHTPDLSQFDNLSWQNPDRHNMQALSLSEDPVPLDNHILNWRELVGSNKNSGHQ
jgi:hypothetical protein